jgi:hypothetical protein
VIPAGTYYVFNTSNVVIQAVSNYNTTSNVATFSNVYPINSGGFVVSDGVNVQLLATTNATVQLITVNGGQNATGTFNSLRRTRMANPNSVGELYLDSFGNAKVAFAS